MESNLQEQVIDFIKKSKIQANKRLPNERELSTRLNTTRGKIRNVLLIMENHGLLFRKHGSGTYLSEKFIHRVEKIDARVFERKDQINGFLHSIETAMPNIPPALGCFGRSQAFGIISPERDKYVQLTLREGHHNHLP